METELILLLVAALIAGINKLMEVARNVRRKSAEEQQRREDQAGVELEEAPKPIAKRRQPQPQPEQRTPIPFPEFNVPLPIPEVLAPRPPQPQPEHPRVVRRPRRKRVLQLGADEIAARQRPIPPRRREPAPTHAKVARTKVVDDLRNAASVRRAIVLREVLGPPVALRHRWQRWRR